MTDATTVRPLHRLRIDQVEALPTLRAGHTDDLKLETASHRLWLSRLTRADGEPYDNAITVEQLLDGRWQVIDRYAARARDKRDTFTTTVDGAAGHASLHRDWSKDDYDPARDVTP